MADRYFKINKDRLTPINNANSTYDLRLRIVSKDQNRSSFWSPIYSVNAIGYENITSYSVQAFTSITPKTIKLVWEDPNNFSEYDIFAVSSEVNITTKQHKSGDAYASFVYSGTFSTAPAPGDAIYLFGTGEFDGVQKVYDHVAGTLRIMWDTSANVYESATTLTPDAGAVLVDSGNTVEEDIWICLTTISSRSYEFIVPTGKKIVRFALQRSTYPKKYNESHILFETANVEAF